MFSRQLLLSVCLGHDCFLGLKLRAEHGRAIYVITEDSNSETREVFKRQLDGMAGDESSSRNLELIIADELNLEAVLTTLRESLETTKVDLIVIDALGDIFAGRDGNDNMGVREGMKPFHSLANRHGCHILFVTHINKSTYGHTPDQSHVQGAGAFAQKARVILDLRPDSDESGEDFKILSITKANALPRHARTRSMILHFDQQTFLYSNTGERRLTSAVGGKAKSETKETAIDWPSVFDGAKTLTKAELSKRVAASVNIGVRQAARRIDNELGKDDNLYLNPSYHDVKDETRARLS